MTYLMQSEAEAERLRAQERANPSRARLIDTGLAAGARAVDVGCGSGEVLASMAELVGAAGHVTGIEPTEALLGQAAARLKETANVTLRAGALPQTGLSGQSFDYVWCQYVFEYLKEPAAALTELVRLARPGGKVIVTDLDGLGLAHWPTSSVVEEGIPLFQKALARTGFDLFVGRKLFHLFRQAGLLDVKVHVYPFYVVAGRADDRLLEDWRVRFKTLAPVAMPEFGGETPYQRFVEAYLRLFEDENALKYAIVLCTEGTRS